MAGAVRLDPREHHSRTAPRASRANDGVRLRGRWLVKCHDMLSAPAVPTLETRKRGINIVSESPQKSSELKKDRLRSQKGISKKTF
jgi:hypothetical protein